MVPFADLFNHKAAVVQLAGGYFVEEVCLEGQPSSEEEEEEKESEEEEGEEEEAAESQVDQCVKVFG